MKRDNQLPKHLSKSLDLDNFEVIDYIPLDNLHPVVVMRDNRPESKAHWCIQYLGSGHYFHTLKEVTNYCIKRNWIKTA